ncbi:hypothetical protein HPB48_022635 [Haemaphysalis longicornis]|uniref:Uncharacterized protein n=1 Tax=Haemaphysalis longicornis TaxID=44386 RepID=A0A9J6GD39_HAELO|nr:hypothetical protein HPB48_022635 [Haemaphysalis longicornis]
MASLGSIISYAIAETLHASRRRWTQQDLVAWNQSHACMHGAGLPPWTSKEPDLLKHTIALAAVVAALKNHTNGVDQMTLKEAPELSGTQLLFVAWCHLQCGRAYGQQLCNKPLRELHSFFKVFKCSGGAK